MVRTMDEPMEATTDETTVMDETVEDTAIEDIADYTR